MRPMTYGLFLGSIILALPMAGCGIDGDPGRLALKIHYYSPGDDSGLRTNDPPPTGSAPDDITGYRICVNADDMDKARCDQFNKADHPTGAKLDGIKPGENRTVFFKGYDAGAAYEVHWCGKVSGVDVKENETTPVEMYITICSDFTPVRKSMTQPRVFHTATVLPDGRVLVVGGFSSMTSKEACDVGACHILSATSSIDIYNPKTGQFEPSSGMELIHPRGLHTATLLPDGRVLVAGGAAKVMWRVSFPDGPRPVVEVDTRPGGDDTLAGNSAEIIDPLSKKVEEVNMTTPRAGHRAVAFSNGDVLLVGGVNPSTNSPLASFSRFESASGGFSDIPNAANAPRQGAAVAEFAPKTFLFWGGNRVNSPSPGPFAEVLYEESDGSAFVLTPKFVMDANATKGDPSFYAAAASTQENKVLICGGMIVDQAYDNNLTNKVRLINTFRYADMTGQAESFDDTGSSVMNIMRAFHTATTLHSSLIRGEVLVAGGVTRYDTGGQYFEVTDKAEFFNPGELSFNVKQISSVSVSMTEPRAGHVSVELEDGTVFVSGGFTSSGGSDLSISDTAEIFNPSSRVLRID